MSFKNTNKHGQFERWAVESDPVTGQITFLNRYRYLGEWDGSNNPRGWQHGYILRVNYCEQLGKPPQLHIYADTKRDPKDTGIFPRGHTLSVKLRCTADYDIISYDYALSAIIRYCQKLNK